MGMDLAARIQRKQAEQAGREQELRLADKGRRDKMLPLAMAFRRSVDDLAGNEDFRGMFGKAISVAMSARGQEYRACDGDRLVSAVDGSGGIVTMVSDPDADADAPASHQISVRAEPGAHWRDHPCKVVVAFLQDSGLADGRGEGLFQVERQVEFSGHQPRVLVDQLLDAVADYIAEYGLRAGPGQDAEAATSYTGPGMGG